MASSQDKVIQFHISRLKDKNPEVLLKTIEELLKFGADAEDALPALETVFKNHEDPAVKKAAQEAGLKIFRLVKTSKGE